MMEDTPRLQEELDDLRRRLADTEGRLERAQRIGLLGQLTAGIVHDLSNLLTPLLHASTLLAREVEPGTKAAALASEVLSTSERSASLVRRLLSFLRGEPARPEALSLDVVLIDLRPLLQRLAGENITLTFVLGERVGDTLVDRQQLEQAILNLAANARDAMPGGGMLMIRTANVGPRHVALTVSDTGCGMTEETQTHAFEGLFTTKGHDGTGLGLAAVRRFAAMSGGRVTAWSQVGVGTTVVVQLPRLPSASAEPPPPSKPGSAPRAPDA